MSLLITVFWTRGVILYRNPSPGKISPGNCARRWKPRPGAEHTLKVSLEKDSLRSYGGFGVCPEPPSPVETSENYAAGFLILSFFPFKNGYFLYR